MLIILIPLYVIRPITSKYLTMVLICPISHITWCYYLSNFLQKMYPMYTIIYHLSFLIIVKTVCIIIYWLCSQWRNIPTSSTPTTTDQENTVNIIEALTTVSKQLSSCVKTLTTDEDSEEVAYYWKQLLATGAWRVCDL
jgi:hypothetical protein